MTWAFVMILGLLHGYCLLLGHSAYCVHGSMHRYELEYASFVRLGCEGSLTYDNECMHVGSYPRSRTKDGRAKFSVGFGTIRLCIPLCIATCIRGSRGEFIRA